MFEISQEMFWSVLWLGVFGVLSGVLFGAVKAAGRLFVQGFVATVTINNREECFFWVLDWVSSQRTVLSAQNVKVCFGKRSPQESWKRAFRNDVENDQQLVFQPGSGLHIFCFEGHVMWMTRSECQKPITSGWDRKPFLFETMTIHTFGRRPDVFTRLLETSKKECVGNIWTKTSIFILDEGAWGWERVLLKEPRPLNSIYLSNNITEQVLTDCQSFFKEQSYYTKRGIPYRRGYLLYGPPGCGKTSFVQALAGALGIDICVIVLSSRSLDDQRLNLRLHDAPKKSILLLEDVDAVFVNRNVSEEKLKNRPSVSFSGLLNAIDGVASQEGRLLFMTTNHIEKLDPALIRPGRCDVHIKFDFASQSQVLEMFIRFFPTQSDALANSFAHKLNQTRISMASLQAHLLKYREKPILAIRNVNELISNSQKNEYMPTISLKEWLKRLGMKRYFELFQRHALNRLEDIKAIDAEGLRKIGIELVGHQNKILAMLEDREPVRYEFEYATDQDIELLWDRHIASLNQRATVQDFIACLNQVQRLEEIKSSVCQNSFDVHVESVPNRHFSVGQIKQHFIDCQRNEQMAIALVETELVNDEQIQDHSISRFLFRMGLQDYVPFFTKQAINSTFEVTELNIECLQSFGIAEKAHQSCIIAVWKRREPYYREYGLICGYDAWNIFSDKLSLTTLQKKQVIKETIRLGLSSAELKYFLKDYDSHNFENLKNDLSKAVDCLPSRLSSENDLPIKPWLESKIDDNIEPYLSKFTEQKITHVRHLKNVTDSDLKELGISAFGHRKIISEALKALFGTAA